MAGEEPPLAPLSRTKIGPAAAAADAPPKDAASPGDSLLLGSAPSPAKAPIPATAAVPVGRPGEPTASIHDEPGPATGTPNLVADRYEVEASLGSGGMGTVYRAYDRQLDRFIALKLIHEQKRDGRREARFLSEARAMARVTHAGCIQIFDMELTEGVPYIAMELVEGRSLAEEIEQGPLPPRRAARILLPVAAALQRAHEVGVLHRDVKPSNILVTRDGAKLGDFGVARDADALLKLTAEDANIGTLAYMPPEQTGLAKGEMDPRSDIYAFGATLYECLTGMPPFLGTRAELMESTVKKDPAPPRSIEPSIPPELEAIVLRCLKKIPRERYPTALDLQEALARYVDADGDVAPRASWRSLLLAVALTLASIAAALLVLQWAGYRIVQDF